MKITSTPIPGVLIVDPKIFSDGRGFFFESFNHKVFREITGVDVNFVQDNHSHSHKGVLRGLHYQVRQPQGKLVRVVRGVVFDVAVDIRKSSPTFGQWTGVELSEENRRQLWIPPGFAHGFYVLSDSADFLYKTTEYYLPEFDRSIVWNDSAIDIRWPISADMHPVISIKDEQAPRLLDAEVFS
jgi:dTDP-4-dehydrorhamnose 3,5-epimerase